MLDVLRMKGKGWRRGAVCEKVVRNLSFSLPKRRDDSATDLAIWLRRSKIDIY